MYYNDLYGRSRNTNTRNGSFTETQKMAVWNKARPIPALEAYADVARIDCCGAIIYFSHYGDVNSKNGWEIDHINPVSNGGTDDLFNLQPLQWENNRHKSDTVGIWYCKVAG